MARRYHTLLLATDGVWGVEFGDYSKRCVEDERAEYRRDYPANRLRIVTTGDSQADIDAEVARLNNWRNAGSIA